MDGWQVRIMVYGAGEAIGGVGALSGEIQRQLGRLQSVCTNEIVAATAQLDASGASTLRSVLDPRGLQPVLSVPNVNVGDPACLLDFAEWSAAICPAARSILVLSGHGLAWQDRQADELLGRLGPVASRSPTAVPPAPGAVHHARSLFGHDPSPIGAITKAVLFDGHNRDYLSNAELGAACSRVSAILGGKISVLVFDACLMSAVEILQELRGSVATVVGSMDELSAAGIDLAVPARRLTEANGPFDSIAMARTIATEFRPTHPFDSCVAIDLDGANWGHALSAFGQCCRRLLDWIKEAPANGEATIGALRIAGVSVVKYSGGNLADIGALAKAIADIPALPEAIGTEIRSAETLFRSSVIARVTGDDYRNAMGLSVFAPGSATVYATNRPDYMRLQFPSLTGWSAVLDVLYNYASDNVRLVSTGTRVVDGPIDAEFVVSLRGLPTDEAMRKRLERLVQRTILGKLAEVDALIDASFVSLSASQAPAGTTPGGGTMPTEIAVVSRARPVPPLPNIQPFPRPQPVEGVDGALTRPTRPPTHDNLEIRAVIQGIRLGDSTKDLIDAELRRVVSQEIGTIANGGVRQIGAPSRSHATGLRGRPGCRAGEPGEVDGLAADRN